MKIFKVFLLSTIFLTSFAFAQQEDNKTAKYLENFATYFGIDAKTPWQRNLQPNNQLPDYQNFDALIDISRFLYDNQLFFNPNLLGLAQNTQPIQPPIANLQIDQQPFATSLSLQAVKNMLSTPLSTEDCDLMASAKLPGAANCLPLETLMENVIGELPDAPTVVSTQLISQLDLNSLLGPLQYDTKSNSGPQYGSPSQNKKMSQGLTAQNDAEIAANFIRFVTGQVHAMPLPSFAEYSDLLTTAKYDTDKKKRRAATAQITNYLTRLRSLAAQASVGISNFTKMMRYRQINPDTQESPATTEYRMATWRVLVPKGEEKNNWQQDMENSPAITLQRQMLYLLAEMNYQLYLSRMQNERILATVSATELLATENHQEQFSLGG